jgi:hypothetical protein
LGASAGGPLKPFFGLSGDVLRRKLAAGRLGPAAELPHSSQKTA